MTPSSLSEFIYDLLAASQAGSNPNGGLLAMPGGELADVVPLRPCPACRGRGVAQDHPDGFGNYDQCPGCEGTGMEGMP